MIEIFLEKVFEILNESCHNEIEEARKDFDTKRAQRALKQYQENLTKIGNEYKNIIEKQNS